MKIAILSANLGNFDIPIDPVKQTITEEAEVVFHRWTDSNFPPITGLTPRFQYRIPKMFGWQMLPSFDSYLWFDGSMSLQRPDCLEWFLKQLGSNDIAFLKHPERTTIKQEVDFIEEKLRIGNKYLSNRYKNGLHKECYDEIIKDKKFKDDKLYASTAFIYRNNKRVQEMFKDWWWWQSRFYSCDQIPLPYVLWKNGLKVKMIDEELFDCKYLNLVNKHK
jgi:hypothetical protein